MVDSTTSMRLLSHAVRARELLLLTVDSTAHGLLLRAAYDVDGDVRARGERTFAATALRTNAQALAREMLVRGGTIVERPMYRNPIFWTVVVSASITTAVIVGLIVAPRPVRVEVSF
jgi:hypothetical protein